MKVYRRLCAWCNCPMGWFPEPQRLRVAARFVLWLLWRMGDVKTTHGACDACVEVLEEEWEMEKEARA